MFLPIVFLIVMVLWFFFGFYNERIPGQPYPVERASYHFITFVLFGILGYAVFWSH